MKTIIMAGGRGTRISSVASDIPKPLIKINNRPVLELEIENLRAQNLTDIIITVSYMSDKIINYFGDGSKFGVKIEYFIEEQPLGNAGALFRLRDKLTEDFLLLNADSIFDVDFKRFAAYHKAKGGLATLFTHPNSHPYDSALLIADENNAVTQWLTKEDPRPKWYRNRVNAGLHIINPNVLNQDLTGKIDLDRQLLKPLCGTGKMFCYDSPEYVKDMGTPERYKAVCADYEAGRVHAKNLTNKQRAVFLDRDGTINKYVGFLRDIDDFELLPGATEAIRSINESGYLAIVVTNQPVIARGELTFEQLNEIHNKMETLLGREGAYVDAVYYCPHHPHKGFPGEIPELKIDCECRKPKPGMILNAAKDFNIDLSQSWLIGDSDSDMEAGKAAGCCVSRISSGGLRACVRAVSHVDTLIRRYPVLSCVKQSIINAYEIMSECYERGGKLLIAGNGGSAADSEHIAGELMKRFKSPRPVSSEMAEKLRAVDPEIGSELAKNLECSLTAIPLVTHEALTTAYINDVDGLGVFAQQLFGFGREGDVFLGISTSGNSKNIINAAVTARAMGIKIIGLTGANGGKLAKISDVTVRVPADETYMIQELHLPVYHCWCLMLEDRFFNS